MYIQATSLTFLALALSINPAHAQDAKAPTAAPAGGEVLVVGRGKGVAGAAGKRVVRGTITNVNAQRREFTVKRASGEEVVVTAGPEVRNFDQIQVGDQLVLREVESVILSLQKAQAGKQLRERSVAETAYVAKAGDKPGIAATRETHIVADVIAVNKKDGSVTLKGASRTRVFNLTDPTALANIKKGDQVEAVIKEGESLSIETPRAP
jgi:Cu/Ag efflux protein CusF